MMAKDNAFAAEEPIRLYHYAADYAADYAILSREETCQRRGHISLRAAEGMGGRGDGPALHEVLGKCLATLEPRRLTRGPEYSDSLGLQRICDTCGQRSLWPDDDQVRLLLAHERLYRFDRCRIYRKTTRKGSDTSVTGCADDLRDRSAPAESPYQSVFATTASEHQNLHIFHASREAGGLDRVLLYSMMAQVQPIPNGPDIPASPGRAVRQPRTGPHAVWAYFGPAFVASVAYIDPGNFATNIQGGAQFGYRLLWVLLWSNAMAILIQYLSAKLGIVTGLTLPQACRLYFSRPATLTLWVAAELAAVATDMAEFLGAAIGIDLLLGPTLAAHGMTPVASLFTAALIGTVLVFLMLALDLAGHLWLERAIIGLVAIIGLCYGFEVFLVHPDWHKAVLATLIPTLDRSSAASFHDSIYTAVGMLGATVMPHVVYLHSALVQPRLRELTGRSTSTNESVGDAARGSGDPPGKARKQVRAILSRFLHFELIDVFVAMNGAWLINSAMILMAAVAFAHLGSTQPTMQDAYHTLGPLFGRGAAVVFAVALLCSGLSSSTVGVMAGQVIIEGFLAVRFPIFLRRFITVVPALVIIALGLDPLKILVLSQVALSFALPFALVPLLLLTNRASVMQSFRSSLKTRIAGWIVVGVVVSLNLVYLGSVVHDAIDPPKPAVSASLRVP
jgi:manganese transport protein